MIKMRLKLINTFYQDIMSHFKHNPKKEFGQNFLKDIDSALTLVESCNIKKDDIVIEIGPGQGFVTQFIQNLTKNLILVEIDNHLIPTLKNKFPDPNIKIINMNILDFNPEDFNL